MTLLPAILIVTVPSESPNAAAGNFKVDPLTLAFQDRKRSDSGSNDNAPYMPLGGGRRLSWLAPTSKTTSTRRDLSCFHKLVSGLAQNSGAKPEGGR